MKNELYTNELTAEEIMNMTDIPEIIFYLDEDDDFDSFLKNIEEIFFSTEDVELNNWGKEKMFEMEETNNE